MTVDQTSRRLGESRKRVAIVGGGLAGLSAAETLARHYPGQFEIALFEAKRFTGGRAGSFDDPRTRSRVDYCQHVAMGCCTNFIALLQRCGLEDHLHRYTELQFLHPDFKPSTFAPSSWLPPPLHLASTLGALQYLTNNQRRQIRRGLWRIFRTSSHSLADVLANDWLSQHGQDADTIRDFWSVIAVSALGETLDVVSMAAVRKVFVDGFAAARGASDVLVPKLPLAELMGKYLTDRIRELGVEIREGCKVRSVEPRDSDAVVTSKDGGAQTFEHVVVAVPWYAIDSLLPKKCVPNTDCFVDVPASPITGVHLWFDRQITERPHAVLVGTAAQWLFRQPWEPSAAGSEFADTALRSAGEYYQVVISASQKLRSLPKDALVGQVVEELMHAFPDARQARLLQSRVVTDPKSVFSIRPEFEAIRPPANTAHCCLHLAGDWIATGWPATMEGAVISGRMAASSIADREALELPGVDPGLLRGWLARLLIRS
ncbi:MAG: hydroxysqualene dehydroxylase HpnE [Rubripirellula sp.]